MTELEPKILLTVDTAIGGGSYGIFAEGGEIDSLCNSSRRSKAEDLISDISSLLKRNGIDKKEINKIIFSNGPGSQTGIRIGAATAKGLKSALNCFCLEMSVLNALVFKARKEGFVQTSVQISQNDVCRQVFEFSGVLMSVSQPEIINVRNFIDELDNPSNISETIFLSGFINGDFQSQTNSKLQFCEPTENIARLLFLASNFYKK